jgi:uncharacterized protein (TIGR03437 family)
VSQKRVVSSGFFRAGVIALGFGFAVVPVVGQNGISVASERLVLDGGAYGEVEGVISIAIDGINVSSRSPANVKFKVNTTLPNQDYTSLIVSPSSGITPAVLRVAVNPKRIRGLRPGNYELILYFTTVDQSPPSNNFVRITLRIHGEPPPVIGSVVNSASLQSPITPGGIVSIFGTSLGPPVLSVEYDGEGQHYNYFGDLTATFDGIAAPLLYLSPGRIDAVAPKAIAGQKTVSVVVQHYGQTSPAFIVPVVDTSPAIFISGKNAIQNVKAGEYASNSADNPAAPGSVVVLFASGYSVPDNSTPDGRIRLLATRIGATLTIGGKPATLAYSGTAPFQLPGILQVNAVVPDGIGSGPQPVVLAIAGMDNASQNVTMAIQ